jgi:hypothetical protein
MVCSKYILGVNVIFKQLLYRLLDNQRQQINARDQVKTFSDIALRPCQTPLAKRQSAIEVSSFPHD